MITAKSYRIAIADDHAAMREGLAAILEQKGYEVIATLSNGQLLIDFLSVQPLLPHLCIIDLEMPVMNGRETIAAIRSRWPDIGLIAYSAALFLEEKVEGADAFWSKNTSLIQLYQLIATHSKQIAT